jgi:hypothetical protein
MKCHLLLTSSIIILIYLSTGCTKEKLENQEFPRIKTLEVVMFPDSGAQLKGEIFYLPENCEIIDHGFIWSLEKNTSVNFEKISLGPEISLGTFSGFANRAMMEGTTYYFRAYVQTKTTTVYGTELSFVSLGSKSPVVTDIYPLSGSWNDTISIRGKYLITDPNQMTVFFNDKPASYINYNKTTDSLIKIIVPASVDSIINKISVKYGNVIYPSDKKFTLNPNINITSISPNSGSWNTLVKIKGDHLKIIDKVLFNDAEALCKTKTDTLIEVSVPYSLTDSLVTISLKKFSMKFDAPVKFKFIAGKIGTIIPNIGTVGTQVLIKVNNIKITGTSVYMADNKLSITSSTDSSITVTLPQLSKSGLYQITLNDGVNKISYQELFKYRIPHIDSTSKATYGDTLTVYGSDFDSFDNWAGGFHNPNSTYINKNLQIVSHTKDYLKLIIPENHQYFNNLLQLSSGIYKTPDITFNIPDPIIEEITPPVFPDTKFKIIGKYLPISNNTITLVENNSEVSVNSKIKDGINCSIKGSSMRGYYSVKINVSGTNTVTKNNVFKWNSPISMIYQKNLTFNLLDYSFVMGSDANSAYFTNYSNAQFYYDQELKKIDSVNNILPKLRAWGTFSIGQDRYIIGGIETINTYNHIYKKTVYKLNTQTKTLTQLSDFPGTAHCCSKGITINNKGYIISGVNSSYKNLKELWEFNPVTQQWTNKISFPFLDDDYYRIYCWAYNNEIFVFNSNYVWKYNPASNVITRLSDAPDPDLFYVRYTLKPFFLYENKLYFKTDVKDLCWEYNLTNDTWRYICDFPNVYMIYYYYSINNKGYFIDDSSTNKFTVYEFDPSYIK